MHLSLTWDQIAVAGGGILYPETPRRELESGLVIRSAFWKKGCQRRPGKLLSHRCKMCGRKGKNKERQTETHRGIYSESWRGNISTRGLVFVDARKAWFLTTGEEWLWGGPGSPGSRVVVLHVPCAGIASVCTLAQCCASLGREDFRWTFGDWTYYWKSSFFFFGLFIYTCLCYEPNLYLKSWYSLSIFYFVLFYLSWIVILM